MSVDLWWSVTILVIAAAFLSAWVMQLAHAQRLRRMLEGQRRHFQPIKDDLWWRQ